MLTQSQISQLEFVGKLDSIRGLFTALKSINFTEDALFQFTREGLRVIVENSNLIQANVYITKECFSQYLLPTNTVIRLKINLNIITECLSIFSTVDCSMKMVYKGEATPMILVFEHHGDEDWLTECSIKTKTYEEPIGYALNEDSSTYNCILLRGPDFASFINDIDKSAEKLQIFISDKEPHFKIETFGVMQSESCFEIARNSDIILQFLCKKSIDNCYKYSHIKMFMKSLLASGQVALKTDDTGMLEMQFMIQQDEIAQIYIQFFIPPLADIDN
ncbi:cell cycle checkpoint protein RAD1 isoform X2 [Condylostylus longicornis]|nr:cell cycle checkpoint protein RAD1 isoform X2 [Condylostylus longicornis]